MLVKPEVANFAAVIVMAAIQKLKEFDQQGQLGFSNMKKVGSYALRPLGSRSSRGVPNLNNLRKPPHVLQLS